MSQPADWYNQQNVYVRQSGCCLRPGRPRTRGMPFLRHRLPAGWDAAQQPEQLHAQPCGAPASRLCPALSRRLQAQPCLRTQLGVQPRPLVAPVSAGARARAPRLRAQPSTLCARHSTERAQLDAQPQPLCAQRCAQRRTPAVVAPFGAAGTHTTSRQRGAAKPLAAQPSKPSRAPRPPWCCGGRRRAPDAGGRRRARRAADDRLAAAAAAAAVARRRHYCGAVFARLSALPSQSDAWSTTYTLVTCRR